MSIFYVIIPSLRDIDFFAIFLTFRKDGVKKHKQSKILNDKITI